VLLDSRDSYFSSIARSQCLPPETFSLPSVHLLPLDNKACRKEMKPRLDGNTDKAILGDGSSSLESESELASESHLTKYALPFFFFL
jgi:hypothetical protein